MPAATSATAKAEPRTMSEETRLEKVSPTPPVITTPQEYTQSITKWQSQHFHVLTPAANFSGLPPQYGMVAALVQLNPDPAAGDVYQDPLYCDKSKGEVAIAKIGLSKIAQAAGMSIKTERTDPRTIQHYWEVKATVRFIGLDGRPQELEATVEYDLRDGAPRVNKFVAAAKRNNRDATSQIEGARMHGLRGAEARAINAAIRLFGIRQKYTQQELAKPFVTLRVMFQPDMSDPETRRLVTERALQGTTALYGTSRHALPQPSEPIDVIGAEPTDSPRQVGSSSTASPSTFSPSAPAAKDPDQPPTPDAVRIVDIKARAGEKNGRKWTCWTVIDSNGVEYSTFSETIFKAADKAKGDRAWVELADEQNGEYRNITEIAPAGQQPTLDGLNPSTDL